MPTTLRSSSIIKTAGNKPKIIEEVIGRVNSGTEEVSNAKMKSPAGLKEPAQTPEFDEFTFVLKGKLEVETRNGSYDINEGEAVIAHENDCVKYSSPEPCGAEYITVCIPAFSPDTIHRDQ